MAETIAVVALLVSVWAVVEARKARWHRFEDKIDAIASREQGRTDTFMVLSNHEARLSALEARCERMEAQAITVQTVEWNPPPVHRTPSADRPEVKNVETDEAGH